VPKGVIFHPMTELVGRISDQLRNPEVGMVETVMSPERFAVYVAVQLAFKSHGMSTPEFSLVNPTTNEGGHRASKSGREIGNNGIIVNVQSEKIPLFENALQVATGHKGVIDLDSDGNKRVNLQLAASVVGEFINASEATF